MTVEERQDTPEAAPDHWRLWTRFLRVCFATAAGIMILLALMWIFLV